MRASDAIIKSLEEEKVHMIFGYPGGAILPFYDSLRTSNIEHILVRHEQSAAHSASGYARATGKVGVCTATSGPGATNLITGIATAYMDSIPLVIITGQVDSNFIGKDVFQEADITGATEPFTKHNYLVKNAQDLPKIIKEAFYIASSGRPGPVLIDIPVDIQKEHIKYDYPKSVNIPGYKPTYEGHAGQVKRALQKLKASQKPLICVGGGIICAKASKELKDFAEKAKIPVVHTLMGIGALPSDSPYYVGMVGSHGHSFSNQIVMESDLLMIIGTRVGDRATAGMKLLNEKQNIIHVDIDPAEVGKNIDTTIPIVGDAKNILKQFSNKCTTLQTDAWMEKINQLKETYHKEELDASHVNPKKALNFLSKVVDDEAILAADVGQNQLWAARNFKIKGNRKFFTSGGLGTMGYSLPAAIGAKLAFPEKTVICVVGDGGLQMSLSELGTILENDLNIIILLFNNSRLGMVRELQDIHYESNYFSVTLNKNPDFVKIAEAYGLPGKKVTSQKEFEETIQGALTSKKGYFIECVVDSDFSTL
ncbi:biosynthetic-type acetolactate synthase large subunit [Crassaminicella profunda]|uniref:biosynthetic-type acetolactate synthase large subunit n=1 Tax=Crassaminicella profunda TaxID=1286698 RepID=UPI001CA71ABF|nr:biosynthetic-type acetolactate synthase large subunit [Crassaminicella profunda]QZY55221.1 biosynthetic-type acetolactate synthase large subunit [Crassaminicella profunda]